MGGRLLECLQQVGKFPIIIMTSLPFSSKLFSILGVFWSFFTLLQIHSPILRKDDCLLLISDTIINEHWWDKWGFIQRLELRGYLEAGNLR